jgi:hypothetical protein
MMQWWTKLDSSDQATLAGGMAVGLGLVGATLVASRLLTSGVEVRLELEPATRNLVDTSVRSLTQSVNQMTNRGVPIGVRLGPALSARARKQQT